MKIVEEFMNAEKLRLNWFEKMLANYPVFYFAKDFEFKKKDYEIKQSTTIRPSIFRRTLAIILISVGVFGWFMLLLLLLENKLFPITLIFIILISVWIGFVIWTFFINPKYSYKIKLDGYGINIAKLKLPWGELEEAIVMIKGTGRSQFSTLVLFTHDQKIYRYSLNNMGVSTKKILKLIEVYRVRNKNVHSAFQ